MAIIINQSICDFPKMTGSWPVHHFVDDVLGDEGSASERGKEEVKYPSDKDVFEGQHNRADMLWDRSFEINSAVQRPFVDKPTFHSPQNTFVNLRLKRVVARQKHRNRISVEMLGVFETMNRPVGDDRVVDSVFPRNSNRQLAIMDELGQALINIRANRESFQNVG